MQDVDNDSFNECKEGESTLALLERTHCFKIQPRPQDSDVASDRELARAKGQSLWKFPRDDAIRLVLGPMGLIDVWELS